MSKRALIILVKNPEPGKVKTRLAKTVGDLEAMSIYQQLVALTQRESEKSGAKCVVYYSSQIVAEDLWGGAEKKLQSDGDLGQKISSAFKAEFSAHDQVCIIGTDCANLTADIINQAFDALDCTDFVIGPANDGGYYLLGMNAHHSELFDQIEWSTDQVMAQTISKINAIESSYSLLPELIDVDTIDDWNLVSGNFK
ncbi:MAG: TIGR04282 family arsenosugar biosynthesis glycosyltransferase [Reichenbachiella sp.]|uniref:TIGR04282 family arsenosugar biosynthesis glycosyltransferase n=1 Tax=Reichenbachiella sp. TaxID=2184521 RepID=UPI003264C3D4